MTCTCCTCANRAMCTWLYPKCTATLWKYRLQTKSHATKKTTYAIALYTRFYVCVRFWNKKRSISIFDVNGKYYFCILPSLRAIYKFVSILCVQTFIIFVNYIVFRTRSSLSNRNRPSNCTYFFSKHPVTTRVQRSSKIHYTNTRIIYIYIYTYVCVYDILYDVRAYVSRGV